MSSIAKGIISGANLFLGGFLLPICPPVGVVMIAGGAALGADTIKEIDRNHKNIITNEILNINP